MVSIISFVVWLAIAYACYWLAGHSRHHAILALILGLIFGPLALLVYLILYLIKK